MNSHIKMKYRIYRNYNGGIIYATVSNKYCRIYGTISLSLSLVILTLLYHGLCCYSFFTTVDIIIIVVVKRSRRCTTSLFITTLTGVTLPHTTRTPLSMYMCSVEHNYIH